jgi:hypothetical protein
MSTRTKNGKRMKRRNKKEKKKEHEKKTKKEKEKEKSAEKTEHAEEKSNILMPIQKSDETSQFQNDDASKRQGGRVQLQKPWRERSEEHMRFLILRTVQIDR